MFFLSDYISGCESISLLQSNIGNGSINQIRPLNCLDDEGRKL